MSEFKQLLESILFESQSNRRAIGALSGFSEKALYHDMPNKKRGPGSSKTIAVNTKSNRVSHNISTSKELNSYTDNHLHTGHTLVTSGGQSVASIHPKGDNKFLIRDHTGEVVRHEVATEKEKTKYKQTTPVGSDPNRERIMTPVKVSEKVKESSPYHTKEDVKKYIASKGKYNLQLHHVS